MAGIEEQVMEWRRGVMEKPRRGITRPEYVRQFLALIRERVNPLVAALGPWQVRHAVYQGPGKYTWADPSWRRIEPGQMWGGAGLTGFFRSTFTVPKAFSGHPLMLDIFMGGDGVISVDGNPFAGLECFHREIMLAPKAQAGRTYTLGMEICVDHQVTPGPTHTFHYARAVTIDPEVEAFYWDISAALGAADNEWAEPKTADYLFTAIEEAMVLCDPYAENVEDFRGGMERAREQLARRLRSGAPAGPLGELSILGHSHLDPVYLWDYREFQRKILRTHTTQLMLMKEYPEWKFSQSQALIYRELKELYPAVYAGIKERVHEGRWEPLGGMFLEPDCNLASGESLVRQFLVGQRFFRKEFDLTCRVGWLPDVFGLPQSMPQIMKGCGIDYFYTAKLVWNDSNEWNNHLFWWEAPDGSRILTHTPPLHFIGTCEAPHIMKYQALLGPKKHVKKGLYTYGWGDGGGGVERRMLFVADRYRAMPGVPALRHQSALDYFQEQEQTANPQLHRWKSELYLETHRGTYTSAALLKKYNRQAEIALRETEILSSISMLGGVRYDQSEMNKAWEGALLNQFHDILPGSHVEKGFTDAVETYQKVFAGLEGIKTKVLRALGGATAKRSNRMAVFNSLLWPRTGMLELEPATGRMPCGEDGTPLPSQTVQTESGTKWLVQVPEIPACGFLAIQLEKSRPTPMRTGVIVTESLLENDWIRLKLDAHGEVISLKDKVARREYIPRGEKANRFQLFEDNPGKYDAWDIARLYEKRRWDIIEATSVRVIENGPIRACIEVTKSFSKSKLRQRFYLEAGARWVDSSVWIDWHEDHRLLKLAFPVNVQAKKASYHVPYGVIERSTCDANRWDKAKFEAPAQMFVDLSEKTHGFSLINDCKYGFDIKGHVMRMTLLKAPQFPNPYCDRHEHTLAFRLYPHAGGWREGGTWQQAQGFNTPATVLCMRNDQPLPPPMMQWQGRSIVQLEAWKKAEDSDHFIVRIREVCGKVASGKLKLGFVPDCVMETNMLEDEMKTVASSGQDIQLRLNPHQVLTLKLSLPVRRIQPDTNGRA